MTFWPVTASNELMSEGRQKEKDVSFEAAAPLDMLDEAADELAAGKAVELLMPVEFDAVALVGVQMADLKMGSLLTRKDS